MKKLTVIFLILLLAGAALVLPELLLSRQEDRLYREKTMTSDEGVQYDAGSTTLARRLYVLGNCGSTTTVDFSVGAQLYYDREELAHRFLEEMELLSTTCPDFRDMYRRLLDCTQDKSNEDMETEVLWRGSMELSYQCVVDRTTGDTFFIAQFSSIDGYSPALWMDMTTGKLIQMNFTEFMSSETRVSEGDLALYASTEEMMGYVADYLDMELSVGPDFGDWLFQLTDRETGQTAYFHAYNEPGFWYEQYVANLGEENADDMGIPAPLP
ncbi:MAG: hypothetical protein ACI3V3_03270 [Faecousia sp.]